MRRIFLALALALSSTLALADTPFPDTKPNHWVYEVMAKIKKDNLWYRGKDIVPKRKIPTRADMATRSLLLALDSQQVIQGFRRTTEMYRTKPSGAATKAWSKQFAANFPQKKKKYQDYLSRVTRLWNFFEPEIRGLATARRLNANVIEQNLKLGKITLDSIQLKPKRP